MVDTERTYRSCTCCTLQFGQRSVC